VSPKKKTLRISSPFFAGSSQIELHVSCLLQASSADVQPEVLKQMEVELEASEAERVVVLKYETWDNLDDPETSIKWVCFLEDSVESRKSCIGILRKLCLDVRVCEAQNFEMSDTNVPVFSD